MKLSKDSVKAYINLLEMDRQRLERQMENMAEEIRGLNKAVFAPG